MSHTCRECGRRVSTDQRHLVRRMGGGAYNRAARMIATTICTDCVLRLAPRRTRGAMLVGLWHWDALSIQMLARDLMTPFRPYYVRR